MPNLSEAQQFNAAINALTSGRGWQQFYSVRAESLGRLKGYWYYHEDGHFYDRVVMSNDRRSSNALGVTGHTHRLTDAEEERLYEDIEAGTVQLARVPSQNYERHYPFSYVY